MSDAIDRLKQRLDDVAAPDQWDEVVARAAIPSQADPVAGSTAKTHSRRRLVLWAAAAALLVIMVAGVVVVDRRQPTPPVAPDETLQPVPSIEPAPSTTAAGPTSTEVPTTTANASSTTTTVAPAAVSNGIWLRECTEQAADPTAAPPVDEFADGSFGPLAPEPGMQIVFPNAPTPPGYSPPVANVMRVAGGLLVNLTGFTATESARAIVLVNDDGTIRWRRCLPDLGGSSLAVSDDGSQAYTAVYTIDSSEAEWWSFDVDTGASMVLADEAAATAEAATAAARSTDPRSAAPEVGFDFAGAPSTSTDTLRRVDPAGSETWRRTDLFAPPGEGFRTSLNQSNGTDDVTLVRACTDHSIQDEQYDTDGNPCALALVGIDTTTGLTRWVLEGRYGVSLVDNGLAVVTALDDELRTSQLLDLFTGQVVPQGISSAPGAFYEECCAGHDYNRVESAGPIAWTLSNEVLNVWFPADQPGPGTSVDLFGPTDSPTVTARPSYATPGVCFGGAADCTTVRAAGTGFTPGATVTATCWADENGSWTQRSTELTVTVSPDGSIWTEVPCVVNAGEQIKVTIDGVDSEVI